MASLEPSVGITSVVRVQRRTEAALDPARDRRAQLGQPLGERVGRLGSSAAASASRMNGGVSSRGSPTPKSIDRRCRAPRASRLASVSRTKGYVRRPGSTGEGSPSASPRSARARGSRARARRPRSTRRACGPAAGRRARSSPPPTPACPNSATGVHACLGSIARSPAAISASTSGRGRPRPTARCRRSAARRGRRTARAAGPRPPRACGPARSGS